MQLARASDVYPVFSNPEVRDVRDNNTVFSAVAGVYVFNVGLEAEGVSRPVWAYEVSGQYFEVTGIKPFLGCLLQRADDVHPGVSDAVMLSWPAWKSYFGADPTIVGKKVRINKRPYTIVGATLSLFGGFGLLLTLTGTFSVASYTVGKRLRELSIRVALGARGKQILWAALGRMLVLLACGSAVGILLGVAGSQILSAIVYQASAQDPFVLVAVGLTVLITGAVSVAGPVRRALRVDPARLLREE